MTYLPATRKEIHLDQATEQLAGVVQLRTNEKKKGIMEMMRLSVDYDDRALRQSSRVVAAVCLG